MTQTIRWTSPSYFAAATADLKLLPYQQPCTTQVCPMYVLAPYTIATGIPINQDSYNWNVGSVQAFATTNSYQYPLPATAVPAGQYGVQICQSGTNVCDASDALFTIVSQSQYGSQYVPLINCPIGYTCTPAPQQYVSY